jgi:hypothetical protein
MIRDRKLFTVSRDVTVLDVSARSQSAPSGVTVPAGLEPADETHAHTELELLAVLRDPASHLRATPPGQQRFLERVCPVLSSSAPGRPPLPANLSLIDAGSLRK